ncbi:hypothetical protein ACMFMG_006927 [Clarireedia jacksonii]
MNICLIVVNPTWQYNRGVRGYRAQVFIDGNPSDSDSYLSIVFPTDILLCKFLLLFLLLYRGFYDRSPTSLYFQLYHECSYLLFLFRHVNADESTDSPIY